MKYFNDSRVNGIFLLHVLAVVSFYLYHLFCCSVLKLEKISYYTRSVLLIYGISLEVVDNTWNFKPCPSIKRLEHDSF